MKPTEKEMELTENANRVMAARTLLAQAASVPITGSPIEVAEKMLGLLDEARAFLLQVIGWMEKDE